MRRHCKTAAVHLDLPPIAQARERLREALSTQFAGGDVEPLVKTWPPVIIKSATPQEAVEYLRKRLISEPPPSLVRFAREVFAASRYAMHHPPPGALQLLTKVEEGLLFISLRSLNSM